MPLASMTKEVGSQIGYGVGKLLEVNIDGAGNGWDQFLHIKVDMDITKPLARGRLLTIDQKQLWVPIKYERLPTFCFQYRVIKQKERVYSKTIHDKISGKSHQA